MTRNDAEEFAEFVRTTGPRLHRAALLLTGDHHLTDDLTQATYARIYASWRRVARADDPLAYARRTLLNAYLSHRRLRRNSELPADPTLLPEPSGTEEDHATRLDLLDALATLPPTIGRCWCCATGRTAASPTRPRPRDHRGRRPHPRPARAPAASPAGHRRADRKDTLMTDALSGLGTALHDRVRDEHPDLDQLIRVSTRAGMRLRRRRAVGVSVAGVAGVAAVGIVGAALGGSGGTAGSGPGVATQPPASTSTTTRADQLDKLASDAQRQARCLHAARTRSGAPRLSSPEPGSFLVCDDGRMPTGSADQLADIKDLQRTDARLDAQSSGAQVRSDQLRQLGDEATANAEPLQVQQLPVHVTPSLEGWEIGTAADDKFPASKGRYALSVNVRPMSEHASWSGGDPDRPASQVAHVGDNYFVTVQPSPGVPQAVVDELVGALRFDPTWTK